MSLQLLQSYGQEDNDETESESSPNDDIQPDCERYSNGNKFHKTESNTRNLENLSENEMNQKTSNGCKEEPITAIPITAIRKKSSYQIESVPFDRGDLDFLNDYQNLMDNFSSIETQSYCQKYELNLAREPDFKQNQELERFKERELNSEIARKQNKNGKLKRELNPNSSCELNNSETREVKRVRTFEHEVGNWSSFFYVPYPNSADLLKILQPHLSKFESEGFSLCKDFHISLSRTLVLKHFMIDSVFLSMKPLLFKLNYAQCLLEGVKPFQNDEKTTSFISLTVATGSNLLNQIIDIINKKVCDVYKFPHFYEDRDLHMSLFWKNGPIDEVAFQLARDLDQILDQYTAEQGTMYFSAVYDDVLTFEIEEVIFKSGCKTMLLPLNCIKN